MKSRNKDGKLKSDAIQKHEEHLSLSIKQRSDYQTRCKNSQSIVENANITDIPNNVIPNSLVGEITYSLDFAQQISYPNNPEQAGELFFKVPRKCLLFGIVNEGLQKQVTYVIDEAVDCGKGSNVVISYLHHYLSCHSVGESDLSLQADNCAGQNKNNYMIVYLIWRVLKGYHRRVNYNFMIAGHTKFTPDRCFGLIKKKYRSLFCSSVFDVAAAINESSIINQAEICGLPDGRTLVDVYDWKAYFRNTFKPIDHLLSFHRYEIFSETPGVVVCRKYVDSDPIQNMVLKKDGFLGFPEKLSPKGLSYDR